MDRIKNKVYFRIPGGEVQVGTKHGSVTVWFRGHCYRPIRPWRNLPNGFTP